MEFTLGDNTNDDNPSLILGRKQSMVKKQQLIAYPEKRLVEADNTEDNAVNADTTKEGRVVITRRFFTSHDFAAFIDSKPFISHEDRCDITDQFKYREPSVTIYQGNDLLLLLESMNIDNCTNFRCEYVIFEVSCNFSIEQLNMVIQSLKIGVSSVGFIIGISEKSNDLITCTCIAPLRPCYRWHEQEQLHQYIGG